MKEKISLFLVFLLLTTSVFLRAESACECEDCLESKPGWHYQKELLYWKAFESGLAYANKPSDVLRTDNYVNKSSIIPNFHWEYGFRLQGGYTLCDASWSFDLSWAHISSRATGKKTHQSGSPEFLGSYPVWSMSSETLVSDYVSSSKLNWYLHTNIIDADAQYNIIYFENLRISPLLGVRCLVLNQRLKVDYKGGTFFSGTDKNLMRNRFVGAGGKIGLNAEYRFFKGFSLGAGCAISPMGGVFHTSHKEIYLNQERYHMSKNGQHFALSLDYNAVVHWSGIVFHCFPVVSISMGWESHSFYKQNRLARGNHHFFKRQRHLTLEGWTFIASLKF